MAETTKRSNTTDKLVIDIKVNVKKGATAQITSLTKSLTKLNEVVKNTANIEKYANALRTIGKELTRTTKNKGVAQFGGANLLETQETNSKVQQTKDAEKQDKVEQKINKTIWERIRLKFQERLEARKLKQEQKDIDRADSFFKKFGQSIGRIALYRAIRASLSGVVKMLKEGLENLRAFDSATDTSFKKMELSATTFKNSLASLTTGLIQGVQPYITQITDTIGNMVNRFNEAQAVLNGSDKYMKILTSDTKEWKEQVKKATGTLLEFDKFLSLNQTSNNYTGFIEAKTTMSVEEAQSVNSEFEETRQLISEVLETIKELLELLNSIWNLVKDKIKPAVSDIKDNISATKDFVDGISDIINGEWSQGLEKFMNGLFDMNGLLKYSESSVGHLQSAFEDLFSGNIDFNEFFRRFQESRFKLFLDPFNTGWLGFANGGMVEKGTRFIAGEAGAEVVHTSARGTGVTNIEQFSQAMLQALATYGVARGSDVSFKGDVYIDRTKAGQLLEGSVFGEGVRVGHFKRV